MQVVIVRNGDVIDTAELSAFGGVLPDLGDILKGFGDDDLRVEDRTFTFDVGWVLLCFSVKVKKAPAPTE